MPTSSATKRLEAAEVGTSAGRSPGREAMGPSGSNSAAGSAAKASLERGLLRWSPTLPLRFHQHYEGLTCGPYISRGKPWLEFNNTARPERTLPKLKLVGESAGGECSKVPCISARSAVHRRPRLHDNAPAAGAML